MTEDDEPLPADEMPKDLAAALRRNARARTAFEAMPPSHRRRYVGWVTEAKREERRARRIQDSIRQILEWADQRGR